MSGNDRVAARCPLQLDGTSTLDCYPHLPDGRGRNTLITHDEMTKTINQFQKDAVTDFELFLINPD